MPKKTSPAELKKMFQNKPGQKVQNGQPVAKSKPIKGKLYNKTGM